jgi:hypothetical protein
MFPDNEIVRNYKTKERAVADYVISAFPNVTWIADKKIEGGCSYRRPDLLLDLGYQAIIVEVDENMHQSYDTLCENKRIMQISQDLRHNPIIMIKFNPDSYYTAKNIKVPSCWTTNSRGLHVVDDEEDWNHRLDELYKCIDKWTKKELNKTVEIEYLFYDKN